LETMSDRITRLLVILFVLSMVVWPIAYVI
jgi:hypothetical protein